MIFLGLGAIFGGARINWVIFRPLEEPVLGYSLKILAFVVTISGGLIMWFVVIAGSSLVYLAKLVHDRRAYI